MLGWSEDILELDYVWPILPRCHKVDWLWGDILGQEIPNLYDPYNDKQKIYQDTR